MQRLAGPRAAGPEQPADKPVQALDRDAPYPSAGFDQNHAGPAAGRRRLLDAAIANKQAELKLYYTGEDDWYNIGSKLNNWQYDQKDAIAGMEGSYQGYTADLKVTYK